jgi:hypothetical protein
VQSAIVQLPSGYPAANAFIFHDEVERKIFDKELGVVLHALAVKRVQHCMPSPVRRCARALHWWALAHFSCMPPKWTLINLPFFVA